MKLESQPDGIEEVVRISLSMDELYLIASSVNEAIECVDDWEFETRLGASKAAARNLHAELGWLLRQLQDQSR